MLQKYAKLVVQAFKTVARSRIRVRVQILILVLLASLVLLNLLVIRSHPITVMITNAISVFLLQVLKLNNISDLLKIGIQ